MFRVLLQKINESGDVETLEEGTYKSIAMLGETEEDGRMAEIMMGMSLLDLSAMIMSAKHFRKASKMGEFLMKLKSEDAEDTETRLIDLLGGLQ